jgi:hypothetical protein
VSTSKPQIGIVSELIQYRDAKGNKPWIDGSATAMRDFWRANATWLPTWGQGEDRGMTVKSVKMWQQGKCK